AAPRGPGARSLRGQVPSRSRSIPSPSPPEKGWRADPIPRPPDSTTSRFTPKPRKLQGEARRPRPHRLADLPPFAEDGTQPLTRRSPCRGPTTSPPDVDVSNREDSRAGGGRGVFVSSRTRGRGGSMC